MKVVILFLATLFFAATAVAAPVIVTWTNPTQRVDGSLFPSTQIQSTYIEWGSCAGGAFGVLIGSATASGAVTNYTTQSLPAGDYCFRAFTVDMAGVSSSASNVVAKTITTSPPKPPVLTTVATTAYIQKGNASKPWYAAVGRVALGTECGARPYDGSVYATVPRDAVTITSGAYKGQTLYGICS